ncbi:MAG: hypothetical protein AB7T06_37785 [Kofleriaceae bacterium]
MVNTSPSSHTSAPRLELAAPRLEPAVPRLEPAVPRLEPAVPSSKRSFRAKTPWFSLVGIVLLVLLTLGNAAANMVPFHVPTPHELQQQEQREIAEARRVRVDSLIAEGDRCRPHIAHEIARGLVYVGRSARAYAADYQQRCGMDPIVERWGNAPMPRRKT